VQLQSLRGRKPLKSYDDGLPDGLWRLGDGALGLIALILASAGIGFSQSVPGNIRTIPQPTTGHAVFDASGNTYYLSGQPTPGAAQISQPGVSMCVGNGGFHGPVPVPCPEAVVSKVDSFGHEIWGALLGGPTADNATALAVAPNGNVAFTGSTDGQFPTTPGAAIESSTSATAFAAMVSADGGKFLYSTYLPVYVAASSAIAVDAAGNAYIAGKTSAGHAFVLKLSADGSTIHYNVTLAGSGADTATAITVDPAGNALVAGQTASPDFPAPDMAPRKQINRSPGDSPGNAPRSREEKSRSRIRQASRATYQAAGIKRGPAKSTNRENRSPQAARRQ
jgi:hypothetical protein